MRLRHLVIALLVATLSISCTDSSSPTAGPEPPETVALTVQKDGDGAGTVGSDPAGISCGADCPQQQADFEEESSVILSAEPADGSVFAGWSGDVGDADPEASTLTLTMDAARTVTATFSTEDAGGGTPQVTGFDAEPTSPTGAELTAVVGFDGPVENLQMEFDYGDGETDVVENPEEIGVGEFTAATFHEWVVTDFVAPEATATNTETGESDSQSFEITGVTLTVEKEGSGSGTVTGTLVAAMGSEVVSEAFIDCGTTCENSTFFSQEQWFFSVTLEAEADEGSRFVGWDGDLGSSFTCSGENCIGLPIDQDRAVVATFEPEDSGNESCTEQPLEAGAQFAWGGQVEENDPEGSTNVQATVDISGAAEFVPGTEDADRGTWTTFTPTEGILDIGTTSGGEVVGFSFDVRSTGAGTATWTFSASDEGGVRGTIVCDFTFE